MSPTGDAFIREYSKKLNLELDSNSDTVLISPVAGPSMRSDAMEEKKNDAAEEFVEIIESRPSGKMGTLKILKERFFERLKSTCIMYGTCNMCCCSPAVFAIFR